MNTDQSQTTPSSKAILSFIIFVCRSMAVSMEVFLHRSGSFGERYISLQAAAVFLVIPFYTLFWPGYDVVPLMGFLLAFLFMCLVVRLSGIAQRRRGGPKPHSYYTGTPRLMRLTGRISERSIKTFVQPMLVFVIGALTMPLSQVLGGYFIVAGVGLLVSAHLSFGTDRVRAMDMHDAAIDASAAAEELRAFRGE